MRSAKRPCTWPWASQAPKEPPKVQAFEIPTFDGGKRDFRGAAPAWTKAPRIDGDAVFRMIVACYPSRSQWNIDVDLQAALGLAFHRRQHGADAGHRQRQHLAHQEGAAHGVGRALAQDAALGLPHDALYRCTLTLQLSAFCYATVSGLPPETQQAVFRLCCALYAKALPQEGALPRRARWGARALRQQDFGLWCRYGRRFQLL